MSTTDTFLSSGKIYLPSVGIGITNPQHSLHLEGLKHIDTRGTWWQYDGNMICSTMGVGIGTTTTFPLRVQTNLYVPNLSVDTCTASSGQWTTGYINGSKHTIDNISIPANNIPYIAKQIFSYQTATSPLVYANPITFPRGHYTFRYDGNFYATTAGVRSLLISVSTDGGITYAPFFTVWHDMNTINNNYSVSGTATIAFGVFSTTITHWKLTAGANANFTSAQCAHHLSVVGTNFVV